MKHLLHITDEFGLLKDNDFTPFDREGFIVIPGTDTATGGLYSSTPESMALGMTNIAAIGERMRIALPKRIPAGYRGVVLVDVEHWIDGFGSYHANRVMTYWLQEFKEMYPCTEVAFYGIPHSVYRDRGTAGGTSYEPGFAAPHRLFNDRAQPVVDEQTAVICTAYARFRAVDGVPEVLEKQEDRKESVQAFAQNMVREGQRMAIGRKPVYLMTSARYTGATSNTHLNHLLHKETLVALRDGAIEAKADGFIIWTSLSQGGNKSRERQEIRAVELAEWFGMVKDVFD